MVRRSSSNLSSTLGTGQACQARPTRPDECRGAPDGGLSDAHRDHIVALLREHFAAGRFEVDEFGRRVEVLLGPATADQAAAAVEDLPPLTESGPEPHRRWWRRLIGGRHAQSDAAQAGWLPTRERFRDPSSGRLMRVWVDPADAGRHYVPDDGD